MVTVSGNGGTIRQLQDGEIDTIRSGSQFRRLIATLESYATHQVQLWRNVWNNLRDLETRCLELIA